MALRIQRALDQMDIRVMVIDPASVEMPRRFRRAKTGKLDGKKLLRILRRSRMRRRVIVAVARKLLIALWRCLEEGVPPAGGNTEGSMN